MNTNKYLFSNEDNDLQSYDWNVDHKGYVRRGVKKTIVFAHRIIGSRILGRPILRSEYVDHINGNTIDNRRDNLRVTTPHGNSQHLPNCHMFRGTTFHHKCRKWQATVGHNGRTYYLGLFKSRTDAANASARKRSELNFLSFPEVASK